ncbi:MAG: restriction endonuclease [Blastochloris sp.]|nr:restriction endonuclease [Blastochloris sp.]
MARSSEAGSLSLEQQRLLNKARVLGPATALPVILEDGELARICAVILADIGRPDLIPKEVTISEVQSWDYYGLPLDWFSSQPKHKGFLEFYTRCVHEVQDFETYFKCLCELHKRRRKYERIMSAQPIPTMLQVAPRALLEFGILATPALASWLTWRKWFYDIDNRAAQETGYLFEPILANALGGTPYGARNSPIKRRADGNKGRQVDCLVDRTVYEFKLRVTIAASGQGRFGEELDFAEDCKASGFKPVLLVLDPTPSHRLDDLTKEYSRVEGEAYIGDDAWRHLEKRSGKTMATFIAKYVRRPIASLDEHAKKLLDLAVSASADGSEVSFTLQDEEQKHCWTVRRAEMQEFAEPEDDE